MNLTEHIRQHHNNSQAQFARSEGVNPQQVTRWIKYKCLVINGVLCKPIKELNK